MTGSTRLPASPAEAASAQAPPATSLPTRRAPAATVTFRMFAAARAAAGAAEVHVEPGPTSQVVAALAAGLTPRFAAVLASSSLVADGVRLDHNSSSPIPGGRVVDVLPPFAGG